MVSVGDFVENFEALDQDNVSFSLEQVLSESRLVLFFYPKAMSPLCTKESCQFRDLKEEFAAAGACAVGVSADVPQDQKKFSDKHDLGLRLLSDEDGKISKQFGVSRFGPLPAKRATFVIDQDRRISSVFQSETKGAAHADQALVSLKNE